MSSGERLRAALSLVFRGDLDGVARKVSGYLTGRAPALPRNLSPVRRPAAPQAPRPLRSKSLIWMMGPSFERSGAPASQFELACGLSDAGFDVRILAGRDGPMRTACADAGIDARVLPEMICSAAAPALYSEDVSRLARTLREAAPDCIIASTIDAFPVIDAARLAGIASIWNIRESEPWRERLADRHKRIAAYALGALSYPAQLVFVSESSRAAFAEFAPAERSRVIYNAPSPSLERPSPNRLAELRAAAGVSDGGQLIVSVGTLCPRKGQTDLAAALGRLAPEIATRVHVAFVGATEPAYETDVRNRLPASFKERVRFAGLSDEGAAWIAAADILVNTSRSEAFPRTFLEAAVMGTPIIASAVDGANERLRDGVSALLYPPGDINALAARITQLVDDQASGSALAAAARADLSGSWTWEAMVEAYARLLLRAAR